MIRLYHCKRCQQPFIPAFTGQGAPPRDPHDQPNAYALPRHDYPGAVGVIECTGPLETDETSDPKTGRGWRKDFSGPEIEGYQFISTIAYR